MAHKEYGCMSLFITIFFLGIFCITVPSCIKGCANGLSCSGVSPHPSYSAEEQQRKYREKYNKEGVTKNPCKSCNGKGVYFVNTSENFSQSPDCQMCALGKRGRHYHKCMSCYGSGHSHE